jgi:preprotein translocase subunit SecB
VTDERSLNPVRADLVLERLHLSRALFVQEFIPANAREVRTPNQEFDFEIGLTHGGRADVEPGPLFVKLTIRVEPDLDMDQPYRVEVAYTGEFSMNEAAPWSDVDVVARANCAAILFPYARQLISDLTSRGTNGPLHMPTINVAATLAQAPLEGPPAEKPKSRGGRKKAATR